MQTLLFDLIVILNWLFLIYFVVINIFYAVLIFLSAKAIKKYNLDYKLKIGYNLSNSLSKPLSLIVPAYNESAVIVECVKSFLNLDYPEYEVIVVNDGSKDSTLNILINSFKLEEVDYVIDNRYPCNKINKIYFSPLEPKLMVVDKENGGKADALNAGSNCSRYPYLAAIDSDSILSKDSMSKIMQQFSASPSTVGVGGIVRLSNGSKISKGDVKSVHMPQKCVERIQVIEYLRAFLFGRMGWSHMNILLIISGAFGVFRQDMTQKVNGWDPDSIGEDMDLVLNLHRIIYEQKLNYKLSFAPDPICWTQAPSDLKSLSGQRDRWQRGLMENLSKNRDMIFNPKFGKVGVIGLPYFLFFEALGCVIELLSIPMVIAFFYFGIINTRFFVLFLTVALVWGLILTYCAIFLEEMSYNRYKSWKDLFKMFVAGFMENFGYRQLHAYWRFKGFIKYVFKVKSGWGTIKRSKLGES